LAQIKQEVADLINEKGFEKNQIKILAGLTRLRQICCHPSLFLSNYDGESSKLEQCMEIVEQGLQSGHKMLLFSVYTSMFEIMEKELQERNIKYFKLTGSTKVEERIDLVDEFNQNKDIKVFLVSLKAGGTGLNLIGADMVIHYDPWWNVSSENQATDRAYRIGQKNNVQVYKLITKNSIEEKIYSTLSKGRDYTNDLFEMDENK
jgi:SNF2 family DNA or RNA helicase